MVPPSQDGLRKCRLSIDSDTYYPPERRVNRGADNALPSIEQDDSDKHLGSMKAPSQHRDSRNQMETAEINRRKRAWSTRTDNGRYAPSDDEDIPPEHIDFIRNLVKTTILRRTDIEELIELFGDLYRDWGNWKKYSFKGMKIKSIEFAEGDDATVPFASKTMIHRVKKLVLKEPLQCAQVEEYMEIFMELHIPYGNYLVQIEKSKPSRISGAKDKVPGTIQGNEQNNSKSQLPLRLLGTSEGLREAVDDDTTKKSVPAFDTVCKYCKKPFHHKKTLKSHLGNCKIKKALRNGPQKFPQASNFSNDDKPNGNEIQGDIAMPFRPAPNS